MFYATYPFKSQVLIRMTKTDEVNETQAQEYSSDKVSFLSEKNGIYNRYIAQFDSSIAFVDTTEHYRYFFNSKAITNYSRNIIEQNINSKHNKVAEVFYDGGKEKLIVSDIQEVNETTLPKLKNTWYKIAARPNIYDPESSMLLHLYHRLR